MFNNYLVSLRLRTYKMIDETEVEKLFDTLKETVKSSSVKELNKKLSSYLSLKNQTKEQVEVVLNNVCKEFKITEQLLMNRHTRGDVQQARHIAYYILHKELKLSIGFIANNIFNNNKASVWAGIKRYETANPKVQTDKDFVERTDKLVDLVAKKLKSNV